MKIKLLFACYILLAQTHTISIMNIFTFTAYPECNTGRSLSHERPLSLSFSSEISILAGFYEAFAVSRSVTARLLSFYLHMTSRKTRKSRAGTSVFPWEKFNKGNLVYPNTSSLLLRVFDALRKTFPFSLPSFHPGQVYNYYQSLQDKLTYYH